MPAQFQGPGQADEGKYVAGRADGDEDGVHGATPRYATAPGQAGSSQVKGSGVADGHLVESRRAFRPLRLRLLQQVLEQGAVHAYRGQLDSRSRKCPVPSTREKLQCGR